MIATNEKLIILRSSYPTQLAKKEILTLLGMHDHVSQSLSLYRQKATTEGFQVHTRQARMQERRDKAASQDVFKRDEV